MIRRIKILSVPWITKSRFSSEEKIGRAQHILFRNIRVIASRYNPGYSISLIGGVRQ